jgi:hypothetical protein
MALAKTAVVQALIASLRRDLDAVDAAARAAELAQHLAAIERAPAAAFSLVTLREASSTLVVLLSKQGGGGQKVVVDGVPVQIVTPQSPIGSAVAGLGKGDEAVVEMGKRVRRLSVVDVA